MATAKDIIKIMQGWLGYSERNGKHKQIIDVYNNYRPLARGYKVKYTDEWCATCVSAAFIKAGAVNLVGTECSVQKYIDIFKSKGIWEEDGRITPKPGDIICYNWDTRTQPNDGWADHIGLVEKVEDGIVTVIEGNKGEAVARRNIKVGHGQIRGYARPKYAKEVNKKTNEQIAKEVIAGKWGSGKDRKIMLINEGYDYDVIQKLVNEMLKPKQEVKANVEEVAKEVIAGKWGVGSARKQKLEAAGYNYNEVQSKVNELLGNKSLKVGSKVKVKQGSKSYDGKNLANFVYKNTYEVFQVDKDRVVIGKGKNVTAAINKKDIIIV